MGFSLRVSVLDHCQLRCRYCLPASPPHGFLLKERWLSLDHYRHIAQALLPLSIEKIRFTGGEPLLRADLPAIIEIFAAIFATSKRALTTNGLRFSSMKDALFQAGLEAVTFHLDTLKEERYGSVMGRGEVNQVLCAIDDAKQLGLEVKINMVVQKGVNDDEIIDFLHLSKRLSVEVRFIELMDTGSAKTYVKKTFISGREILDKIKPHGPVVSLGRKNLHDPASSFNAQGLDVSFGLIASDTEPFCSHCNRLRLSADGRLYTCLYEPVGHDVGLLSELMPSTDELLTRIKSVVAQKTSFHPSQKKLRADFSMSKIGG